MLGKLMQNVRDGDDFSAAFAAFDNVRRPRTERLVATSEGCGHVFDFEGDGVGDDVANIEQNLAARFDWIFEKDIDEDVEQALRYLQELRAD